MLASGLNKCMTQHNLFSNLLLRGHHAVANTMLL